MALQTFNPVVRPSPGIESTPEIKLNSASFGDGYSLDSPNGLNHIRQIVSLKWDGLTADQRTAIETFFVGLGGYKPFLYRPYGYAEPLRWTCGVWSGSNGAPFAFQAKLRQSFNLG